MENQIWFDGLGSHTDFGLLTASQSIETAEPRVSSVTVPGRDGSLDLSEAAGRLLYEDRKAQFTFLIPDRIAETARALRQALHGKKMKIVTPAEPERYLTGRVSVGTVLFHRGWGRLTVTCACEPFYTAVRPKTITLRSDGGAELSRTVRSGSDVPISAELIVSGDDWTVNGESFAAGTHTQALTLQPGANAVSASCSGTGTLAIAFREVTL